MRGRPSFPALFRDAGTDAESIGLGSRIDSAAWPCERFGSIIGEADENGL